MPTSKKTVKPAKKRTIRKPAAAPVRRKAAGKTAARKGSAPAGPAPSKAKAKSKGGAKLPAVRKSGAIAVAKMVTALQVMPSPEPPAAAPAESSFAEKTPKQGPAYQPDIIEPKWQKEWDRSGLYRAVIDRTRKKFYALTMLPYSSGDLHIGHWYAMTPSDARARFMRMRGWNVMFPVGFDSFGLPAENAAIKRGIHPKKWTYSNIEHMRGQLRAMGSMWDWEREAVSSDPEYYRWTQWFFIQLFRHGLAYKKMSPVDWCPNCNTTLAREQVWGDDRHCERCETPVIKKNLDQWFFRITKYAEELLDFSGIDWPERVRTLQTNWIGRSEGARVVFRTEAGDPLEVFTTRPDTLWGATFMVLAPEHPLVQTFTAPERKAEVTAYVQQALRQSDIQRESADKEKTGVFTGGFAINPVNGVRIPVWIADYVVISYGTGAIMAVPAHDRRDFDFALKYGLPILPVIDRTDGLTKSFALAKTVKPGLAEALRAEVIPFEERDGSLYITIPAEKIDRYIDIVRAHLQPGCWNEIVGTRWQFIFEDGIRNWDSIDSEQEILARCQELEPNVRGKRSLMEMVWSLEFYRDALFHDQNGMMIHSGQFSGTPGAVAVKIAAEWLATKDAGGPTVSYRLRDWLISRQRFWGAPIPLVRCPVHGQVPVPEDQLPVLLPDDVEWKPTGESPLKLHPTWSRTTCPVCGGEAERETDTMDTFMCSSWYHLRYLSPKNERAPFDPAEYDYWMPVDCYTGGIEHATMHLIYTRFFHKACRDMGVTRGSEPVLQLRNQGIILGEDSEKMSKSRGNVIAPDVLVKKYGADTVRAYLMFFARWDQGAPWSSTGIEGTHRWINRVWGLAVNAPKDTSAPAEEHAARILTRATHQTIRRVTRDFERFEFNTIISAMMEFTNLLYKYRETTLYGSPEWEQAIDSLLLLAAPVATHMTEELWHRRKGSAAESIHVQAWPVFDPALAAEDEVTIVIQVNGKVRERLKLPAGIGKEEACALALANDGVKRWLEGRTPRQVIFVPDKLINLVV
ncbi:MAG: class I tRNA ligase family protein [Anaerolineales bacterium]|nr:class I tRNA ligase family protein [Anaerolineales bacterium]